jgi:phage-related protein
VATKPIKISILADASAATKSVNGFASTVDTEVTRATRNLDTTSKDTRRSLDSVREGFDTGETRAQGFRDGLTGAQDAMAGVGALAKGDTFTGLLLLGSGAADTASSFANFLIPALSKGFGWIKQLTVVQAALNFVMSINPVFLVVAAIVVLVAILVLAYKKSETFRRIVDAVWSTIKTAWGKIPGLVSDVVKKVVKFFTDLKGKVEGAFKSAAGWLKDAGKRIISGLLDGITSGFRKVQDKLSQLTSLLPDWKGPADRDRRLLFDSGRLVIGGFQQGLEAEYGSVQRSLSGFTDTLTVDPSIGGTIDVARSGSGAGAQPIRVEFAASGDPLIDALFEEFRKRIRVRGGNVQLALGT